MPQLPPYRVETVLTALSETVDWSLSLNHVPELWKKSRGSGVRVAVLDTGIDAEHPDLRDAIEAAQDFTRSRRGPIDRQGHGTHVAGTIAARQNQVGVIGIAPDCRLLVAKVLGDDGAGSNAAIARGIDWAIEQGADILSMSFGSAAPDFTLQRAVERAAAAGKFLVCAAGNDGRDDSVNYPARWPQTVAVAAVDRHGRCTAFSSRGPQVDIAAPGENILSTYLRGRYARLSGTSMAAPFVSGVVALMLAKHRQQGGETPLANIDDLLSHLARTAQDAGPTGRDPHYGYGLIRPDRLLSAKAA